ncbi:hypothetical protein DFR31_2680, partial [Alkalispirillum mobile]
RHSHLTVHGDRLAEVRGDAHLTVQGERRERTAGDQHLTVEGTLHLKAGQAWLSESGRELHLKAGQKAVLEAGAEITLQAGGSFIKLDPAGITLSGAAIRINSGGSPGSGSGQQMQAPELPGHVPPGAADGVAENGPDALLDAQPLSASRLRQWAARDTLLQPQCHRGQDDRCPLTDCPCPTGDDDPDHA